VNDGQHILARGIRTGAVLLDPSNGSRVTLDRSSAASQNAPLACSADGFFAALVVDRGTVRLMHLPDGAHIADLPAIRHSAAITALAWDYSGTRLAGLTEDGCARVWQMKPWRDWLAKHHLD
jgi:WD40 repeat protein